MCTEPAANEIDQLPHGSVERFIKKEIILDNCMLET